MIVVDYFREGVIATLQKPESSSAQSLSITKMILRADPTLNDILKMLNADFKLFSKDPESLLSMLYQILKEKTLEMILAPASVHGKLKTFVSRLIKLNEASKQPTETVPGKAVVRSMYFDVSFLMLCLVVQTHGSDVSTNNSQVEILYYSYSVV